MQNPLMVALDWGCLSPPAPAPTNESNETNETENVIEQPPWGETEAADLRRALSTLEERVDRLEAALVGKRQPVFTSAGGRAESVDEEDGNETDSEKHPEEGVQVECRDEDELGCLVEMSERAHAAFCDFYRLENSTWDASILAFTNPLSLAASLGIVIQAAVNLVTQFFFIYVVFMYLSSNELSSDFLVSLLKFRAGAAHSAKHADIVSGASLVNQICQEADSLTWAGKFQLLEDLKAAKVGGSCLTTLAVLCWLATLVGEMDSSLRFGNALVCLCCRSKRGGTHLAVRASGNIELESISPLRLSVLLGTVVFPRLVIVFLLAYVGIRFLVVTINTSDLLLNALALAFIIDIDNLLFSAFAPRHLQVIFQYLEPLPMATGRRYRYVPRGLSTFSKFFLVGSTLLCVRWLQIEPFYRRVQQAYDIVCSGERDFVFSHNGATDLIEVSPSFKTSLERWSQQELSVLQIANVRVESAYGFTVPEEVQMALHPLSQETTTTAIDSATATGATAIFRTGPEDVQTRLKLQQLDISRMKPHLDTLRRLRGLATQSWWEQLQDVACADMALGGDRRMMVEHLKAITRGWERCYDARHLCDQSNQSHFRALCPVTCGCHKLLEPAASFFAAPDFGCPPRCRFTTQTQTQGQSLDLGLHPATSVALACLDTPPLHFRQDPWLRGYFERAMQTLASRGSRLVAIFSSLSHYGPALGIPKALAQVTALQAVKSIANGSYSAAGGAAWDLAPGYGHPRGLQGCQFWTSWEVKLVLGMDLCSGEKWRSLRPYCPASCGCRGGEDFCPTSCRKGL